VGKLGAYTNIHTPKGMDIWILPDKP